METVNRIYTGLNDPDEIAPFITRYSKSLFKLVSQGKIQNIPLLFETAIGTEFLIQRRAVDSEYGRIVKTDVFDNDMWVFANDRGLSRDLLIHGVREEKSTYSFVNALAKINEEVEDITVLEIGANIGYYALLEAHTIDSGSIYAVEPGPANFDLLERNIKRNKVSDIIDTERAVIGTEEGTAELELSEQSNTHRVLDDKRNSTSEYIAVKSHTIESFLDKSSIGEEEINVVRMDVEGYEVQIIEQLRPIFEAADNILLFIELHHKLVSKKEYERVLETLSTAGFEPISAVYNTARMPSWDGEELNIESIDELTQLPEGSNCVELVAHKKQIRD